MSVTLVLDDEIDISRGTITVSSAHGSGRALGLRQSAIEPHVGRRFEADVVWMDERPLDPARLYLLKHTTRTVTAEANRPLVLNQIGTVTLATSRPLVFDRYRDIRATGSFILIDPATNFTAGAGMIIDAIRDDRAAEYRPNAAERLVKLARVGRVARGSGGRHAARDRGVVEVTRCRRALDRRHAVRPRRPRASRRASRRRTSCWCTCCARPGRTSRSCSSTRSITSRRRSTYRDEIAAKWNLNLINLGAGAVNRPLADEHGRLLRAPQGGAAVRRARGVRHLVHRAAARPVAVARQPSTVEPFRCRAARRCARSARSRPGR